MNPVSNVTNLRALSSEVEQLKRQHDGTFDGGGGGGYDHGMEARIAKLEDDLTAIKVDVAVIKTAGATKEDISKLGMAIQGEINAQTWKLVTFVCGFGTALVAATFYIATHLK